MQILIEATVQGQDLVQTMHEEQIELLESTHWATLSKIEDEHAKTRQEIILEIRVGPFLAYYDFDTNKT